MAAMNGNCSFPKREPMHMNVNLNTRNAATDATSSPGDAYTNWISATKHKLEEREVSLLSIRLEIVKTAIHRTVEEFNNDCINYKYGLHISMKSVCDVLKSINYNLITLCIDCLKQILSEWNGIDLSRSTKEFTTFRKYFVVSKNWFDQRKKSILTQHFWSNILESLREFTVDVARGINDEYKTQYSRYLLFTLLWSIFASKTQFSSTKPQPLIPGGTIKDTNDIKHFLGNMDDSLSMMKLLEFNGKECEQEISAQQTLQYILNQLHALSIKWKHLFHTNIQEKMNNAASNHNNEYNSDYCLYSPPISTNMSTSYSYDHNVCSANASAGVGIDIKPPTYVRGNTNTKQRITNPFLPNINHQYPHPYAHAFNQLNHVNNNTNITNISYSAAAASMNNMDNFMDYNYSAPPGYGYGPVHNASNYVSQQRHSPAATSATCASTYQCNQNNCYQCSCNNNYNCFM